MKDTLTVSVQEAIRICDELLQVVEAHIPAEVEAEKRYYALRKEEQKLEDEAREQLKGLADWWELGHDLHFWYPMPTFFQSSKHQLERAKGNCLTTQNGEYTFSEESLEVIRNCNNTSLVEEIAQDMLKYTPGISTWNRDLLAEKLKGKQKGAKPEGPPTVTVEHEPLPSPWWLIVGALVFVAALVAGSMT